MTSIFGETKKLRGLIAADRIECSPGFIRAIAGEAESGQKFFVKLHRSAKIFHPQINVIENSCFHLISLTSILSLREGEEDAERQVRVHLDFRFSRRIINFNPDHVSSTAQTFMSTNPSGKAISRTTSSVISVGTLADFFGHETQIVPLSAILSRKIDNLLSNSLRRFVNRWTKSELVLIRLENVTRSSFPSSLR